MSAIAAGISMAAGEEKAVIVHSALPSVDNTELFRQLEALEDQLHAAITSAGVGEFDGNEIGQGELTLYMYGPDAEKLFTAVAPVLRRAKLTQAGVASVRLGPPGSAAREVKLSAH
jgi:hypothetical protein